MNQLRTALLIAWLVVSATISGVLLLPLVLAPGTVRALAPACQWKAKYNRECAFCGMTSSFIAISQGDFRSAARRNRGSIPLYLALVGNQSVAIGFALGNRRRAAPSWRWRLEELSCRH